MGPSRETAIRGDGEGRRPLRAIARRLDWGIFLALALGLLAASPFLLRAGLPRGTDAELHVYRAAELGHAIREGVFYPRWAPNLYLGYGYPIFQYYAPLTYYLSNVFALVLPGVGVVSGVKAVFVVGLLVGPVGAYLLARELFDPEPAVIAPAAFVFSPYVLFIDPHARGVLAEHFAICLAPLAFYSFHRLMRSPTRGRFLACVCSLGAVVFSHNLMGLVVSGLMASYWIWQLAFTAQRENWHWGLAAFVLAAALIAFFWVPALLENDAVKLEVIGPGHFDFREHFLSLGELLGPSRLVDWGATGPRFRHNLGLVQWILALPALLAAVKGFDDGQRGGEGRSLLFFVISGLSLVLLMMRLSTVVWESLPVMPYLQFPWRLLGPTNLLLAICAAGSMTLFRDGPWRRGVITAGFALLILTALPLLYPAPWPADFGGTEPADVIEWEIGSEALGTTSTGDFLPVTVEMIPPPMETLVRSYRDDGPVDKVNRATVPEGTEVTLVEHKPDYDLFRVDTPRSFILRLYTFYFPGWQAYVDGESVEIEIARPEGFITVQVPEGTHDVLVRFEDTKPRRLGGAVSGGALVALIAIMVAWRDTKRSETSLALRQSPAVPRGRSPSDLGPRRSPITWARLGGVLLLIVVVKTTVLDTYECLHHHSAPGQAVPAQHKLRANFGGKIELLGYDLPRSQVHPGDTLSVVLYWRALTDVEGNYQSFVHVAQPLDRAWAQEDHLNPGGLPTSRWPSDKYVWDEYAIQIPEQLSPGEYMVNVGLYSRSEGGARLPLHNGQQVGEESIVIDTVEVVSAGRP